MRLVLQAQTTRGRAASVASKLGGRGVGKSARPESRSRGGVLKGPPLPLRVDFLGPIPSNVGPSSLGPIQPVLGPPTILPGTEPEAVLNLLRVSRPLDLAALPPPPPAVTFPDAVATGCGRCREQHAAGLKCYCFCHYDAYAAPFWALMRPPVPNRPLDADDALSLVTGFLAGAYVMFQTLFLLGWLR